MTAHPPSGLFDSLFDSDGTIFMGSRRNPADCRVGLFGVPYDGTTSFRPGTRFGPAAIREVSAGLETYCPQLNLDLEDLDFADLGAVEIPFGNPEPVLTKVKQATEAVLGLGLRPLMLGGEHSVFFDVGHRQASGLHLFTDPGGVAVGAGGVDHHHHGTTLGIDGTAVVNDQVIADAAGFVEQHLSLIHI